MGSSLINDIRSNDRKHEGTDEETVTLVMFDHQQHQGIDQDMLDLVSKLNQENSCEKVMQNFNIHDLDDFQPLIPLNSNHG